jgi:polyisoprenoid-binding protein YceI
MVGSTSSRLRAASHTMLALALWLSVARSAHAEPITYRPAPAPEGSASARLELPYTFGTHNFDARLLQGEVRADWKEAPAVRGRLTLPLASIHGGGDTLNCHMREAMGLDYARSGFPAKHVCSDGKLPATGNDAIAFPDVAFEIERVVVDPAHTRSGEYELWRATAFGRWTIHGVTRDASLDLRLTVPANEAAHPRWVRVEGARKIRLADYGIQVKRAFVVTAGEEATVKLDFLLRAQ